MNYAEIIQAQREYFYSGQTKSIAFRIEQLKKLKAIIRQHESALGEAIYKDFKKSFFEVYTSELSFVYHEIDMTINNLPQWSKRKRVPTNLLNQPGRSYIIPEPLGVCLVIGAWNYPYMLSLVPLVTAIAAGNTVVLKPSEIPASTSTAMATLINQNFPSSYMVVLEGGVKETSEILEQHFDKIFFTGSTTVGKIVYQAAAKHLTPVTLELGGKNPAIVTADTHVKAAAKRIVWGKFFNAGQSCTAPDYVVVDEKIKDEFLAYAKEYILQFDYAFEHENYVQIINERNFNRLSAYIDKAKIYHGGETNLEKRYIAPTILQGVTFEDPVMQDEIFGPVLPVISYSNLNDIVSKIRSRFKPLGCYIFSNNSEVKNKLLHELSFGGGTINDTMMQISNPHIPFGGVGESGIGSYHGKAGFDVFSHDKGVLQKPFWGETTLKYPPYSKRKFAWLKWLLSRP